MKMETNNRELRQVVKISVCLWQTNFRRGAVAYFFIIYSSLRSLPERQKTDSEN